MPSRIGVDRRPALIEAERAGAGDLGMNAHRLGDMERLDVGRRVAIVDPLEAMGGDFPPRLVHRRDRLAIARHRCRHRVDGDGNRALGEQAMQAPEAGPRAVFVDRLHVHVAHARPGRGADDLRQERFGRGVAVQDVVLAALLVVDDELHGDARPASASRRTGGFARSRSCRADRFRRPSSRRFSTLGSANVAGPTLRQDGRLLQPAWPRPARRPASVRRA